MQDDEKKQNKEKLLIHQSACASYHVYKKDYVSHERKDAIAAHQLKLSGLASRLEKNAMITVRSISSTDAVIGHLSRNKIIKFQ